MNPYLSVIIPAFNEGQRIGKTLQAVDQYLRRQQYTYEIIVVDDGSEDDTARLVRELQHTISHLKLVELPANAGKGAAVKAGMLSAKGEARLFMDADGSTAIGEIEKLLPHVSGGVDLVVGSRLIAGAVKKTKQSLMREFLGWIFRRITHILVKTEIEDTQNGFKLFSQSAAEKIFAALQTKGWSFDIEVLLLAKQYGYRVKETPVIWTNDTQSRLKLAHMVRMLFDVLRLSQTTKQFLKFCIVGLLNTTVDFSIYYLVTRELWTFRDSISAVKAFSYLAATACSFTVNRYWTFAKTDLFRASELLRFYFTVGLGVFINVAVQYAAVTMFGLHDLIGVLVAAAVTAVWGFVFAKFFVFKM